MNYFKNRKQSLIKLIKKSILLTSIATPTIIEMNSASAILRSLSRNVYHTGITNTSKVQSLVTQLEKISKTNSNTNKNRTSSIGFSYLTPPSSTNTSKPILQTKITPLKLQPIIKVRGFVYLYGDEPSSNNKTSISTNPKITDIIYPVKTAKSNKIFEIYTTSRFKSPNVQSNTLNNRYIPNNNKTTSKHITSNNNQLSTSTSTSKFDRNTSHDYAPLIFSRKQMNDIDSMIKSEVTAVVERNLPPEFPKTQPIAIQFDNNSGKQLKKALSSFLYFSTHKTLDSINKQ